MAKIVNVVPEFPISIIAYVYTTMPKEIQTNTNSVCSKASKE